MCNDEQMLIVYRPIVFLTQWPLSIDHFIQHQVFAIQHARFWTQMFPILRNVVVSAQRINNMCYLGET